MGGIFGICSKNECATDLFFGTDYHSHLGTQWGGMAVFDGKNINSAIHGIENSPFRMRFEPEIPDMNGCAGIGCISDSDRQPIVVRSKIGTFAIVTVGRINNKRRLAEKLISDDNARFTELSGGRINDTELTASLICGRGDIAEGVAYAQSVIEGSMTMLICADGGLYAARDKLGRTPLSVGARDDGHCVSFESFAYINLGYKPVRELGPGEIVFVTPDKVTQVAKPGNEMRICSFLWAYYGYPTSDYEGVNVEEMRYRCGRSLAMEDAAGGAIGGAAGNGAVGVIGGAGGAIGGAAGYGLAGQAVEPDYIAGIPDSGTAHAIGYANESGIPFARPLIKYTPTWPRSFTPQDQKIRDLIARMKLVPITPLIKGKKPLFVEDSIVRGTQMRGVIDFLHDCGAKELHVRTACPALMYSCKYLNFSRSKSEKEMITRQVIGELEGGDGDGEKYIADYTDSSSKRYKKMVGRICANLNLTTLAYHSLDGLLGSIGVDRCKLCTYCWNGTE